jgi:hypothetical protein
MVIPDHLLDFATQAISYLVDHSHNILDYAIAYQIVTGKSQNEGRQISEKLERDRLP